MTSICSEWARPEAAIEAAVHDIGTTAVDDDGVGFDLGSLQVHPIREDNRYGGIRAVMQAHLAEARIHLQIDVGFGDAVTPAAVDLTFRRSSPTCPRRMCLRTPIVAGPKVRVHGGIRHVGLHGRIRSGTEDRASSTGSIRRRDHRSLQIEECRGSARIARVVVVRRPREREGVAVGMGQHIVRLPPDGRDTNLYDRVAPLIDRAENLSLQGGADVHLLT